MRIVVVGDTLLDEDIDGTSDRLSPDAPVPVIDVESRTRRAGGAGLVATMLARDGHDVALATALSDDEASLRLRECLAEVEVASGPSGAPTPVKTRLRANGRPVARIDEGCAPAPTPRAGPALLEAVSLADAIVVADYGRGLLRDPRLRDALERRGRRVPLVWDPHPRGEQPVPAVRLATPNLAEAAAAVELEAEPMQAAAAAAALRARWGCAAVAVTLGERGALLHDDDGTVRFPAPPVVVPDPCGAGDRFAAAAAVALAEGADRRTAVRTAVASAAAYLAEGGVTALDRPRRAVLAEAG